MPKSSALIEVVPSRVVCELTGVQFPQLYRVTGLDWREKPGVPEMENGSFIRMDDLEPSDQPIEPFYTLDPTADYKVACQRVEPISELASGLDRGWLVIRHHLNQQAVDGYCDAMMDTENYGYYRNRFKVFHTSLGIFSLLHREPSRGVQDLVIVYQTKQADFGPLQLGLIDWSYVVDEKGHQLDIDDLMPADRYDGAGPITDLVNKTLRHGQPDRDEW